MTYCSNDTTNVGAECGPAIKLPYDIESINIEQVTRGVAVGFDVTVNYYRATPLTKRYVHIEDFYKEYNIKLA